MTDMNTPKPGRGGARPDAGRKPTIAARVRSFTVDAETMAKLEAWKAARGAASLSEALRQMVDYADRRYRWSVANLLDR